jgi:hypothetical protein
MMAMAYTARSLFYYPYAALEFEQSPILRAVALYFDKLYLLHPDEATVRQIGSDEKVRRDVTTLTKDGRLRLVNPLQLLARHGEIIEKGIAEDRADPEWDRICREGTSARDWTLALSKVPAGLEYRDRQSQDSDKIARRFIEAQAETCGTHYVPYFDETEFYIVDPEKAELAREFDRFVPKVEVADKRLEAGREYRYAKFPVALGESIMLNHAIAGMLDKRAIPITDDPFHERMFQYKLARFLRHPEFQKDYSGLRLPADLAAESEAALRIVTDAKLDLPMLRLPVDAILEFRNRHEAELNVARDRIGWLAREIAAAPMTSEFAIEVRHKLVPEVKKQLEEVQKARDSWLGDERALAVLKAMGVTIAGVAVVAQFALGLAPITQGEMAKAALSVGAGSAIPALSLMLERRGSRKKTGARALRYLLTEHAGASVQKSCRPCEKSA